MAVDHIRYDILTQEALRGLVRTVLADAAKNGLPGEHHFYVSFDTAAEGVRISPRLRSQYPKEMTIILQHQFWDLTVGEHGFEVGLSFGGIPERLAVPFSAVKGFFDPSVQFGLKFEEVGESTGEAPAGPEGQPATRRPAEHKHPPPPVAPTPVAANPEPQTGSVPAEQEKPGTGGEVVRLDRFRKKQD